MQLHIFTQSPYQHTTLSQTMPTISEQDTVLLTQDAVYALTSDFIQQIKQHPATWLALKDDCVQRGITHVDNTVQLIGIDEFVQLSFKAQHCLSWF